LKNPLKNSKFQDLIIFILLSAAGILFSFTFKDSFIGKALISGSIYGLLPALYLWIRDHHGKNLKKILLAMFIFGVLFMFIFDFNAELTKSWTLKSLVFQGKILGIEPIDSLIGYGVMVFVTLTFYFHFLNPHNNTLISKKVILGFCIPVLIIAALIIVYYSSPGFLLNFAYPYFYMGLVAIAFPVVFLIFNPRFLAAICVIMVFFVFYWLVIELTAVKLGWWVYLGNNYIGRVTLLNLNFPIEELLFWIFLFSPALVCYYEFFINKK